VRSRSWTCWSMRILQSPHSLALLVSAGAVTTVALSLASAGCQHGSGSSSGGAPDSPRGPRGSFAGSSVCSECHPRQAGRFSATNHARTARPVDRKDPLLDQAFRNEVVLLDPLQQASYRPMIKSNTLGIVSRTSGGEHFDPVRWVLGASRRGFTFLCEDSEGYLTESRISYYPTPGEWQFTPGQPNREPTPFPAGRRNVESICLPCHASSVVRRGDKLDTAASQLGVGCESCHGAAQAHVDRMRHGLRGDLKIAHLSKTDPGRVMAVCGSCHRPPSVAPSAAVPDSGLPRFQGRALGMSACFRKSEGRLSCISCHDPHANVERSSAHYDRVCLGCHSNATSSPGGADSRSCRLGRRKNCIPCHMPLQDVGMTTRQLFHLHLIR
jgi:hypothetical protein